MFGILASLFIIIPAVEIYLLIEIGSFIGGFNTIAIVVITGFVGAALAKAQGLAVLSKVQGQLSRGVLPTDQIIHGLLVFGGGLLLLTPGFLTDILGLAMVAPGTRHIIVLWVKNIFQKGLETGNIKFYSFHSDRFSSENFDIKSSQENQTFAKDNVIEVDFEEKK